ncbi:hypothetical protein Srot_2110 [Segniliparus rotundus DSM 44985]|uniref:Uncharacterized protein n=1 Tax=Segniliparus rotundus (strain ATCC BAA-972 / CDC 1076 / CIP 108378 / DSM 44985 / JCM 13578) TaxID=640132 RepID=D6Z9D4_SEGRD|nr:hypothetical protein [Segniliparus rotundus]ADG98564.1 hypothetical protein Srot_2110 [Segniliparus rotundus DSM 44985]
MRNALYGLTRRAGLAASRLGARVGSAVRNAASRLRSRSSGS